MSNPQGCDPLKSMRSFLVDEHSLRDLQSRNTVFLLKIVLTKETKESFKLFDDVFQFFCLAGSTEAERINDPKNLEKFDWRQLAGLQPLDVMTTTDMAADWKLVGAGGGVKQTAMFCTLCPCHSDHVHQPNAIKCSRFCQDRMDDDNWHCYHHEILCGDVKNTLQQEMEQLRQSIALDLEEILSSSKIKLFPNPLSPAHSTHKLSAHFVPRNDDERDEFVDLLVDELVLRGLSLTGELEELRQPLIVELEMEYKLKLHLHKLNHCDTLEACMIALLHKVPCILHCENRIGLKILMMLLIEGFSNAQLGYLYPHVRGEKDRIWRLQNAFKKFSTRKFWEMRMVQHNGV